MRGPSLHTPVRKIPISYLQMEEHMSGPAYLLRHNDHIIDGKKKTFHPVTYMSSLFRGNHIDSTASTKEENAIYIFIKMFSFT